MSAGAYSFLNVQAAIAGPGGSFPLGAGVGVSEEGITIGMLDDKDALVLGADGTPMHSLRASDAARLTLRILKTSPVNRLLSNLYNFQKTNSQAWGQNILVISDPIRGDIITATDVAFSRQPDITFSKDAGTNEWVFMAGRMNESLGDGNAVASI